LPHDYRIKLYKAMCQTAREERERLLREYEARLRERA
jgi:hypothetical protein